MITFPRVPAFCLSLTLSIFVPGAVGRTQSADPSSPASEAQASTPAWLRVPIHTHPDDPAFGPYGTWTAGPDYKASFHDGFTFYPLLGPAWAENLPFAWRTESVRVGDQSLLADGERPRHASSPWRYEYRYRQVVEAYEVRGDGVEQMFVLAAPPAAEGDWVVTGRVVTRLQAAQLVATHGGLTFSDAAQVPLVRYGAAFAVDAGGAKVRAETSFDGERIRLRVDGAWLARAQFPVVLDPLTSRVLVNSNSIGGAVRDTKVGHDGSAAGTPSSVMVSFTRVHAANDLDAYGYLTDDAFAVKSLVFTDTSASLNSEKTSVAYVGSGADRWAIAFQRTDPSVNSSHIRLWAHDRGNNSGSGGSLMFLAQTGAGTTDRNPDVGGAVIGGNAFVVYQTDVTANNTNTPNTEVHGVLTDLGSLTFGTPFRLGNVAVGTAFDRENPSVSQTGITTLNGSWVTVWQEINRTVTDNWDIVAQRIDGTGHRVAQAALTQTGPLTEHEIVPEVDGTAGRYLVTYLATDLTTGTNGKEIRVTRFDAPDTSSSMTVLQTRSIVGPVSSNTTLSDLEISYDRQTDSHWAIAYEQRSSLGPVYSGRIVRVGHTGGIVESATLFSGNVFSEADPGVTCQLFVSGLTPSSRFLVVNGYPAVNDPVYGQTLLYDPAAVNVLLGTGCGGTISADPPYAGDEFFSVRLDTGAAVTTSGILLLSNAQGNVSLSGVGMTGCFLNVDPGFFLAFAAPATGGSASFPLSLPDAPAFIGNVYFQWIWVSPGANPANLKATRGLLSAVR